MEPRLAEGGAVGQELEQERLVAGPDLAEEEPVDDARRLDHLHERAPLALRQARHVGADVHRREAGGHRPQPRLVGQGASAPGRGGARARRRRGAGSRRMVGLQSSGPDVTAVSDRRRVGDR